MLHSLKLTQHQKNFLFSRHWSKSNFQQGQKNFLFTKASRLAVGPTKASYYMANEKLCLRGKVAGAWSWPLLPRLKMSEMYLLLPICFRGVHKDNLLLHNKISETVHSRQKLFCSSNQSARSVMRWILFTVFFVKYKKINISKHCACAQN